MRHKCAFCKWDTNIDFLNYINSSVTRFYNNGLKSTCLQCYFGTGAELNPSAQMYKTNTLSLMVCGRKELTQTKCKD